MPRKVIVSGAGIAGLALAHWLERIGVDTILVDRAERFEGLGHYIALKGNGVEMVRRMGLIDACERRAATVETNCFYSVTGRKLRCEQLALLSKTLGGYILFRRSDLHAALYESVRGKVDIRFGTELAAVQLSEDGVDVELSDGRRERADLLVGADGVHSRTRQLVFGDGFERPLGGYYVAFTVRQRHDLGRTGRSYMGVGAMVNLLPVADNELSAVIYLGSAAAQPPRRGTVLMRQYLLDACEQFPSQVREVILSIGAEDFVFSDAITQVVMDDIVRGRAVLAGDAAHCPTFLSGMGSSLALQDAHVLAGCLARGGSVDDALAVYSDTVRPIAHRYRDSAVTMHGLVLGTSRFRAAARNAVLQIIPQQMFERSVRRFYDSERPLPDVRYP